jgi:hypothetical protein
MLIRHASKGHLVTQQYIYLSPVSLELHIITQDFVFKLMKLFKSLFFTASNLIFSRKNIDVDLAPKFDKWI